jgi:hypothetical protein
MNKFREYLFARVSGELFNREKIHIRQAGICFTIAIG